MLLKRSIKRSLQYLNNEDDCSFPKTKYQIKITLVPELRIHNICAMVGRQYLYFISYLFRYLHVVHHYIGHNIYHCIMSYNNLSIR